MGLFLIVNQTVGDDFSITNSRNGEVVGIALDAEILALADETEFQVLRGVAVPLVLVNDEAVLAHGALQRPFKFVVPAVLNVISVLVGEETHLKVGTLQTLLQVSCNSFGEESRWTNLTTLREIEVQ